MNRTFYQGRTHLLGRPEACVVQALHLPQQRHVLSRRDGHVVLVDTHGAAGGAAVVPHKRHVYLHGHRGGEGDKVGETVKKNREGDKVGDTSQDTVRETHRVGGTTCASCSSSSACPPPPPPPGVPAPELTPEVTPACSHAASVAVRTWTYNRDFQLGGSYRLLKLSRNFSCVFK
jgi:hypothetical protein